MKSPFFDSNEVAAYRRIQSSFAKQGLMQTLSAVLESVAVGSVAISAPIRPAVTQQHGYAHAGAVAAIADSACGYAALTTMPPDADVLTIEFKLNLLAPAIGDRVSAQGKVIRAGRRITVCAANVFAIHGAERKLVALMQATFLTA